MDRHTDDDINCFLWHEDTNKFFIKNHMVFNTYKQPTKDNREL